jgi:hypothetical protein
MTKLTMAKLPRLFLRDGVYQVRVVVPMDLRAAYNGKPKFIRSLGTSIHREAAVAGAAKRAELLQEFEQSARSCRRCGWTM